MQQKLFALDDFVPIKHGTRHYVPVLQNKAGELTALANLTPAAWDHVTPLMHIVGPKRPRRGEESIEVSVEAVRSWLKKISDAITDHPCYLDIVRLRPSTAIRSVSQRGVMRDVNAPAVVLDVIYEAARRRGVQFVPVYPVETRNASHLRMVRNAAQRDGRGVALRYSLLGTISLGTPAEAVLRALADLGENARNSDLLLDLSWLKPDSDLDADLFLDLIYQLSGAAPWRSVVLLGTSMPSSLSCVAEGTVGSLPRYEWQLWNDLRRRAENLGVIFGDYGIQHPTPPHDGGPGMRANIRYTASDETVVARGAGAVIIEGKEQYRDLCYRLLQHPEYQGNSFSWGDAQIQDCADGVLDPGSQNLWRAVGTSHHVTFVAQQVANR